MTNSFKTTLIAVDDSYSTPMNTMLNVMAASGLLQNDFDDNKPGLTVTAIQYHEHPGWHDVGEYRWQFLLTILRTVLPATIRSLTPSQIPIYKRIQPQ